MNTLIQTYASPTEYNTHSNPNVFGCNQNHIGVDEHSVPNCETSSYSVTETPLSEYGVSSDSSESSSSPVGNSPSSGEFSNETDHSNAIFKYITQMLMEEDLENKTCMLNDGLALQATEKSYYDVLTNNIDQSVESPDDHFTKTCCSDASDYCSFEIFESSVITPFDEFQNPSLFRTLQSDLDFVDGIDQVEKAKSASRVKKNRHRDEDEDDYKEGQSNNKHLASNNIDDLSIEVYDKVLLCKNTDTTIPDWHKSEAEKKPNRKGTGSNRGRPKAGQKLQIPIKEVVDLRSLLIQCAQALSSYDHRSFNDLLSRIRKHSSPLGDGTERLAHYMANALKTRLDGTGTGSYFISPNISAAEILKGYETFITACPFRKMSHVLANRTIKKWASNASTLHIIDFGIFYGFQWPCLIHLLSEQPGGPPKLRITGIDFPQSGFRPAERVEDTGKRLAKYCERFNVPFEYNPIAKKWDMIKLEDLKLEENEMIVINSLYRLHGMLDESVVTVNSPRDAVFNLIKKINPDMLILGAVNGTYNAPFFVTRFREALFHYSSMFDVFDATVDREDHYRKLYEEEVLGKEVMNIVACEGTERIDRPETYKQWQVRILRAGFRQLDLDQDIVGHVRRKVKKVYHKDFLVDEDGKWLLQGWRGRVTNAISFWRPLNK